MSLVARHAAHTDIGLHRSTNEDAHTAAPPLYAVADGMGGAQAGEVASRLALDTLVGRLDAGDSLESAALEANRAVFEQSGSDPDHSGMGTTLTALRLGEATGELAHVGDSRLYRLRDGALEQLSDDHSMVGEWVRGGALTREEAASSRYRNVLTRALGTESDVEIDRREIDLRAGDVLLLCTDGLYSMVPDETTAAILAGNADLDECARRLVSEAKSRGGHDNITVIVIALEERDHAAPDDASGSAADAEPAPGETTEDLAVPAGSTAAPPSSSAPASGEPGAGEGPATALAAGHGLRPAVVIVLIAVAVLVIGLTAGVIVMNHLYFVGVDNGMVSVYRGAPYEIAGIKMYSLYLRSTVPIDNVSPALQARVLSHEVTGKDAALRVVRQVQGLP